MNTIRPCGCKGVRSCLQCEQDFLIEKPSLYEEFRKLHAYVYCPTCGHLYDGWDVHKVLGDHPKHRGTKSTSFPGVLVQPDFLSATEAAALVEQLDSLPWTISQSGRRKQNFGPKTNFKKRKLRKGAFQGFPAFTAFIQERFRNEVELLSDFTTIEQCTLEYDAVKGAAIDPHIDDCWIWGERVVTVNCLGDSVLTLSTFDAKVNANKYNLDVVENYEKHLLLPWEKNEHLEMYKNAVIRIPMPKHSLVVLYGPARYQFEHSVLREDIKGRRVCIAYREFTPTYITGDEQHEGNAIRDLAQIFWH